MHTMEAIHLFGLVKHPGEYDSWPLETELLKEGVPTGRFVSGHVLEAQYKCGDHYLLVTSWDCPFEDSLDFILVSEDLRTRSKKHVGVAHASVWLEGHAPISANEALFNCGGDLDVLITVRPKRPWGVGSLLRKQLIHKQGAPHSEPIE